MLIKTIDIDDGLLFFLQGGTFTNQKQMITFSSKNEAPKTSKKKTTPEDWMEQSPFCFGQLIFV